MDVYPGLRTPIVDGVGAQNANKASGVTSQLAGYVGKH